MPHNMSDESVERPGAGLKIERIDGEGGIPDLARPPLPMNRRTVTPMNDQ
jgi:hypothetical protein